MTEETQMEENERKPIFTNIFSPNEETARQLFLKLTFVRRLVIFSIGAVMLGMIVYWFVYLLRWAEEANVPAYSQRLFWISIAAFAVWAYLIVREILAPRTFAKRETRRIRETYRRDRIEVHAAFYDDTVEFHNMASNAVTQFDYPAFGLLTETKDLFVIRTRQKQLIALSKLGFDGTDIAGFRAFMEEKCPDAKRKWRKAE